MKTPKQKFGMDGTDINVQHTMIIKNAKKRLQRGLLPKELAIRIQVQNPN